MLTVKFNVCSSGINEPILSFSDYIVLLKVLQEGVSSVALKITSKEQTYSIQPSLVYSYVPLKDPLFKSYLIDV